MKTRLFILMASSLAAGSGLNAQEKISFEVRGGLNLTDIENESAGGQQAESSF